ncbi:hypothetical protein Tco_0643305 [Tanacetum coccineum]
MTMAKLEAGMDVMNNSSDRYVKVSDGPWWAQFRYGSNPWMARYVYSVMFLLANLLAWAVRDYGPSAFTEMHRLKSCEAGENCLGTEGVLRGLFANSVNQYNQLHYMVERVLFIRKICREMPYPFHAARNYCICRVHTWDYFDVYLVHATSDLLA